MSFTTNFTGQINNGKMEEIIPLLECITRSPFSITKNEKFFDPDKGEWGEGDYHLVPMHYDSFGNLPPFDMKLEKDTVGFRLTFTATAEMPPTVETLARFDNLMKLMEIYGYSSFEITSEHDENFLFKRSFAEPDPIKSTTIMDACRSHDKMKKFYAATFDLLHGCKFRSPLYLEAEKRTKKYIDQQRRKYKSLDDKYNGMIFPKNFYLVFPCSAEVYEKYYALLFYMAYIGMGEGDMDDFIHSYPFCLEQRDFLKKHVPNSNIF